MGPWLGRHALGGLGMKEGAASYAALALGSAGTGVGRYDSGAEVARGIGVRDARTFNVRQRSR